MQHAKYTSSFRYTTGTDVFKWYERRFDRATYTNIIGTFDGLFLYGGPYQQGVSSHIPKIISELINSIPSSDYMLCPLYRKTIDKNNVTNGGDFQLGITGTAHYAEAPIDTLHRELAEETGLTITEHISWDMHLKDGKKETYGINININNTKINTILPPIILPRPLDDKMHKIACIIHGKEYDIIDKYMTKPEIIQWPNEDNIIGVLVISVFMVKRYLLSPFKAGFIRQTPPIVEHPLVFE